MTQKEKIMKYLKGHKWLTSFDAYTKLGITQFAARIKELEEMNIQFDKEWVRKKNADGEIVDFKRYSLKKAS